VKAFARVAIRNSEGKYLLIHTTAHNRNRWELPGGKVDEGEAPVQAARRELLEKVNILAWELVQLSFVTNLIIDGKEPWTGHFFLATRISSGKPTVREPDKADEVRWVSIEEALLLPTIPALSVEVMRLAESISKTPARKDFSLLHQEFDFSVQAPNDRGLCLTPNCVSQGEFAVRVKNDRGELKISRDPVCSEHVLQTFLEACNTDLSPSLEELLESARKHVMTDEEKEAQRQSWVRGEMAMDAAERAEGGHTSMFPQGLIADENTPKENVGEPIWLGKPEPIPTIVCLCGSTKFYEAFQKANYEETMAGRIVLSVGFFMHRPQAAHGQDFKCSPEQKIQLDELHKRKIDLADEVLVLNVNKYIGDSTRSEIEYALAHGKKVRYLEDLKA
jgi:8-oxo-dGTP pyrophosphatase MutT (NUDIX family)